MQRWGTQPKQGHDTLRQVSRLHLYNRMRRRLPHLCGSHPCSCWRQQRRVFYCHSHTRRNIDFCTQSDMFGRDSRLAIAARMRQNMQKAEGDGEEEKKGKVAVNEQKKSTVRYANAMRASTHNTGAHAHCTLQLPEAPSPDNLRNRY